MSNKAQIYLALAFDKLVVKRALIMVLLLAIMDLRYPFNYILMLIVLVFCGGGALSIDRLIEKRRN